MADSGILFPLILGVTMQQVHSINREFDKSKAELIFTLLEPWRAGKSVSYE